MKEISDLQLGLKISPKGNICFASVNYIFLVFNPVALIQHISFLYLFFVVDCILPLRNHPGTKRMSRLEGLRANSSQFTLERKPFRILGGSIHYFRVPRAYWEDRLKKLKACGLNTLTT